MADPINYDPVLIPLPPKTPPCDDTDVTPQKVCADPNSTLDVEVV